MDTNYITVLLIFICGLYVVAGDLCITSGSNRHHYYDYDTENCNECCGTIPNQYCCLNIPALVGGIIGGIILISIIVAVVCVCQKKQRPGHVVQPVGATVIMAHQQGYAMTPQHPGHPAPSYGGNPAYPPPYPGNSNNAPPQGVHY